MALVPSNEKLYDIILIPDWVSLEKRESTVYRVPPSLNVWLRLHWAKKTKYKAALLEALWASLHENNPKKPKFPFKKSKIDIEYFLHELRDVDNLWGSVKPLIDCLKIDKGLGIIQDDSPEYITLSVEQYKVETRDDEMVVCRITRTL